jgi:hypothetical protein
VAVGEGVVGHHLADGDAELGEERPSPAQEGGAGRAGLIGVDLRVCETGVIVHGCVDEVIARSGLVAVGSGGSTKDPVSTT